MGKEEGGRGQGGAGIGAGIGQGRARGRRKGEEGRGQARRRRRRRRRRAAVRAALARSSPSLRPFPFPPARLPPSVPSLSVLTAHPLPCAPARLRLSLRSGMEEEDEGRPWQQRRRMAFDAAAWERSRSLLRGFAGPGARGHGDDGSGTALASIRNVPAPRDTLEAIGSALTQADARIDLRCRTCRRPIYLQLDRFRFPVPAGLVCNHPPLWAQLSPMAVRGHWRPAQNEGRAMLISGAGPRGARTHTRRQEPGYYDCANGCAQRRSHWVLEKSVQTTSGRETYVRSTATPCEGPAS